MIEQWLPVRGYEEFYEIANTGRIRSHMRRIVYPSGRVELRKGREMKPVVQKRSGYCNIGLTNANGQQKIFRFHRLVALHFIPNPASLPEVNHEDFNKQNNAVSNLVRCDRFYQQQHAATKPNRRWGFTGVRRYGKDNQKAIPIVVTGLDGRAVGEFESGNLAALALNCNQAHISACCRGLRKHHKGYKFQFKEGGQYVEKY